MCVCHVSSECRGYVAYESRGYLEPMYLGRYVSSECRAAMCVERVVPRTRAGAAMSLEERVCVYVSRTRAGAAMSVLARNGYVSSEECVYAV